MDIILDIVSKIKVESGKEKLMKQYLNTVQSIFDNGVQKGDRTGTGTISLFGHQERFDLSKGFPLLTTKKLHLKSIIHELLWMIKGETNVKSLQDNGVRIWNEWADENGELGPVYGSQWRSWNGGEVDQIKNLVERIHKDPNCRRHMVTAWNPSTLPKAGKSFSENVLNGRQSLANCHVLWQVWIGDGKLSLQLYQRSQDTGLGYPYNIASYALLTMMLAQVTGYEAGEFIHTSGDAHIYNNHIDQLKEQLTREPRSLPTMKLNPGIKELWDFTYEDFKLLNYNPHPHIKMDISV